MKVCAPDDTLIEVKFTLCMVMEKPAPLTPEGLFQLC